MPREIPDSEDEDGFEFALPAPKSAKAQRAVQSLGRDGVDTVETDPVMSIDFDAICTSTQHMPSSNSSNGLVPIYPVDSSTERFLKEVAPSSSSSTRTKAGATGSEMGGKARKKEVEDQAGKKRSRAEIDAPSSSLAKDKSSARKKPKIDKAGRNSGGAKQAVRYGTMVDGSNDAVHTDVDAHALTDHPDFVSVEARTQYTSLPDTDLQYASMEGHATGDTGDTIALSTSRSRSYTPHTPSTSFTAELQGGTTIKSSMGSYQGYTVNPNNMGGFGYNPFGSASQASDIEHDADHRAISEVFSRSNSHNMLPPQARIASSNPPINDLSFDILHKMQTSPVEPTAAIIAPEKLLSTEEDPPQGSPSYSPITNPDNENEAEIPHDPLDEPLLPQLDKSIVEEDQGARSQPKKRGRPKKKADDTVNGEDVTFEDHLDQHDVPRGFRAGTVDSVSNVSEISYVSTTSKKGRKRKSKKSDAPVTLPDGPLEKLPSDNLGLDRKDVIGLSPERYKPRPSRGRGRAPSEDPVAEVARYVAQEQEHDVEELPVKGKKGKKGKGKKGKNDVETQAKSKASAPPEVIEIEDDFIEVRAETAAVIEAQEDERDQPNEDEENAAGDEDIMSRTRPAKITIDVPQLAKPEEVEELPPPIPEPKKRGRKKKKQAEEIVQVQEDAKPEEERPALAVKDSNIQPKQLQNSKLSPKSSAMIENKDLQLDDEEAHVELTLPSPKKKIEAVSTPIKAEIPSTPTNWLTASKSLTGTPGFNARARIGLSKRKPIPSLLRKVDRNKEAPKHIEKKVKLNKAELAEQDAERIAKEEAEAEGRAYVPPDQMRDKNGMLVEWDF